MAYTSTYTDSDADDEFERSVALPPPDDVVSEGMTSAEHTPTTFTHSRGSYASPTTVITQWTAEETAEYFKSLGLGQYVDSVLEENITGDALACIMHDDLKDIGMNSLGHRLTLLKAVYETKMKQNVPIDEDAYVPLSASDQGDLQATQDDISRVIESIRLRDQRIIAAESELRVLKEDLHRVVEENRKLREETLPLVRMAKDRSHPLPEQPQPLSTPPADLKIDKMGTGLSRKYSTKKLFIHPTPKNPSPTMIGGQQALQDSSSLDPSAAAMAASNHLSANVASQNSPNALPQLSPTSPAYTTASAAPRSILRNNGDTDPHYPSHYSTAERPPNTAPLPSSASVAPSTATHREKEKDNIEIFKSFRVSIEDPCHKVLPVALKRYQINDDWRQYALYIVHGDQERCLGLEEKPLMLFKQLDREGRKPMFMLRKHASPAKEGWSGHTSAAAGQGAVGGGGASADGRGLPGGVL